MQCEVVKAIKDMRDKKARGDDDVPGDVLKPLEEDGLTLMTQLNNNIHETGQQSKGFSEVTMTTLKKWPKL